MNAELIKALRYCGNFEDRDGCDEECPYFNDKDCPKRIMCDAADALEAAASEIESRDLLLEKQKKEIRNLSEKVEYWRELFRRSETVRGMDEKEREALEAERKLLALERRLRDGQTY